MNLFIFLKKNKKRVGTLLILQFLKKFENQTRRVWKKVNNRPTQLAHHPTGTRLEPSAMGEVNQGTRTQWKKIVLLTHSSIQKKSGNFRFYCSSNLFTFERSLLTKKGKERKGVKKIKSPRPIALDNIVKTVN